MTQSRCDVRSISEEAGEILPESSVLQGSVTLLTSSDAYSALAAFGASQRTCRIATSFLVAARL
jgi:hypothetical protein